MPNITLVWHIFAKLLYQ